ncbi:MAG: hypothetical protein HRU25_00215 [Psychrobium sp.]|nr:hypothetical protein [Psychrobium sp.]
MINGFKNETIDVVKVMDESQEYGKVMLDMATKSNDNVTNIANPISDASGMTLDIASAAEEQASAVSDINTSFHQVNELSGKNLVASEQVSMASEKVEDISTQLVEKFSYFKVD